MHIVCLGIVRHLFIYLTHGPKVCCLSMRQKNVISYKVIAGRGRIPNEFAQQMRVLHEIGGKPLNYVSFCYTQVLWYWKLLSPERCKHFLFLTVSMSIMLKSDEWIRNAYRQTFFHVLWWPGKTFPIYSVHGLIHLHEDASHFNCSLNCISCFLFENYLQQINKHVRSVRSPQCNLHHSSLHVPTRSTSPFLLDPLA